MGFGEKIPICELKCPWISDVHDLDVNLEKLSAFESNDPAREAESLGKYRSLAFDTIGLL